MITASSSHNRLIPTVGMPLLSSHAYTSVVSGRKMKPSYRQEQLLVEGALQVGGE